MHLIRYLSSDGIVSIGVRTEDGLMQTGYADMLTFITDGEKALEAARSSQRNGRPVAPKANPRPDTESGQDVLSRDDLRRVSPRRSR